SYGAAGCCRRVYFSFCKPAAATGPGPSRCLIFIVFKFIFYGAPVCAGRGNQYAIPDQTGRGVRPVFSARPAGRAAQRLTGAHRAPTAGLVQPTDAVTGAGPARWLATAAGAGRNHLVAAGTSTPGR